MNEVGKKVRKVETIESLVDIFDGLSLMDCCNPIIPATCAAPFTGKFLLRFQCVTKFLPLVVPTTK